MILLFFILAIAQADQKKFPIGFPNVCEIKVASMPHQKAKDALIDAKEKAGCP